MARYEVYTPVHKGLRYALGVLTHKASSLNFEDNEKLEAFIKEFEPIAVILHAHAVHEDSHIQTLIDKFIPQYSDRLEAEHHDTEELLNDLENQIQTIQQASVYERQELGREWNHSLNRFVAAYLNHLQTEEIYVQQGLWDNMTDEEIMNLSVAIRSDIQPEQLMIYFRYMIPAQNIYENVELLGGMKMYAPPEAYLAATQIAEEVLPTEYWEELKHRLELV